ncbi:16S rRNA (guanine(966)-N(2))-methyltransferase RsmD [candidate division KSB1 bacterium]|nr:16S rRNA (guanine(966)-N(2))-methyltransferase RsmD [candidate division KSB1 bacterium]MBL7093089.1 16S rRNA (guanine(966)-N(2))-methyltransferase RsmD [candidate division KSB1 bacterium]
MRVIAGQCKGRVLFSPKGKSIRPTSDRTKEFIFNYIGDFVLNVTFLDLFAGTGNISIEALSRGAQSATLVDKSSEAIKLIHKNIDLVNYALKCSIIRKDAANYLKFAGNKTYNFGLIFADPPYSDTIYQKILEKIDKSDVLRKGGLFILEHSSTDINNLELKNLRLKKYKKMGNSTVTIYEKKG